ncbi:glyoxalase III HchA [Moritella dasanensis]|uniref:glyoxalase III HchA n=1 Tax=Moritella dasanensis TaxID=428031 RepID=UPI00031CF6D1|nr:glyoxalase III HchA [Moritella dasanensis]
MFDIRKLFGIAPKMESDGSFSPSPVALKLATKSKTNYDHKVYANPYKGSQPKVLMVCCEENNMTMKNGKRFFTGNHPVEMLVPMLHLEQAGFEIDVYTPTGKPAEIEMWAMPQEDDAVKALYQKHKANFENPHSLSDFVTNSMNDESPYIAVYIPGGHGAMLGLPENKDLGQVIQWVHAQDKYMLSICHGPAALLAAGLGDDKNTFVYRGYKIAAFPDSLDKMTPLFGYLPGAMPWYFGEKLRDMGLEIVNKKADGTCHQDRKLITGDSPDAANMFGVMAAEALLSSVSK